MFNSKKLLRTADQGSTWEQVDIPGTTLYINTDNESLILSTYDSLFVSSDQGLTWQGIWKKDGFGHSIVLDSIILHNSQGPVMVRSEDFGSSWDTISLPINAVGQFYYSPSGRIYNHDTRTIYSDDLGITWNLLDDDLTLLSNKMLETSEGVLVYNSRYNIIKSTRLGQEKKSILSGFKAVDIKRMFILGDGDIVTTDHRDIHRSNDDGESWFKIRFLNRSYAFINIKNEEDKTILIVGDTLAISTDYLNSLDTIVRLTIRDTMYSSVNNYDYYDGKIYSAGADIMVSDDLGSNWERMDVSDEIESGRDVKIQIIDGVFFISGTNYPLISTNKGRTWRKVNDSSLSGLSNLKFFSLENHFVIHQFENRWIISTDKGRSWRNLFPKGLPPSTNGFNDYYNLSDLVEVDSVWYATINNNGVYVSYDFGQNWASFNEGLLHLRGNEIFYYGRHLFIGTHAGSVWKYDGLKSSISNLDYIDKALKISPNPGRDIFQIQIPSFESEQRNPGSGIVQVFDQQGRLILSNQLAVQQAIIDIRLTDVAAGVYMVLVTAGNRQYVGRLVVGSF